MSKSITFYYSRRKLGIYLLLNLVLLALAGLFTWIIFPDYSLVYGYALITCVISLLASLIVFIFPMKLAVLNDESIKIDHNEPLLWSQIKTIEKEGVVCFGVDRSIIKLIPTKLSNYHKSLMQRITDSSRFGMFSIPLYAMDKKSAQEITKLIEEHVKSGKPQSAAKPVTAKAKKATVKKTVAKKTVAKKVSKPKKATAKTKKRPA